MVIARRWVAVLAGVPLAIGGGVGAVAAHYPAPKNRPVAQRVARTLIERAVLPVGAVRARGRPAGPLRVPSAWPATPNLVDRHRRWLVPFSMDATAAFLQAHPPRGLQLIGRGYGSQNGHVTSRAVTDAVASPRPELSSIELVFTVAPRSHGRSEVRVDAQAVWQPTRPASERVPAGMHAVTITRSTDTPPRRARRRVVTTPARVTRLARIINRLPVAVPGTRSCPAGGVTYRLVFAASPGARPRLIATEDGCSLVAVRVDGRRQPALQDSDGRLAQAAARALGIATP